VTANLHIDEVFY